MFVNAKLFAVPMLALGLLPPSLALGDTYPGQPFNGLQISYSVSGAQITKTEDRGGFTTRRTLTGRLGSGTLRISGTARMTWGSPASVSVRVSAGSRTKKAAFKLKPKSSVNFNVSVPIGTTATSGSFSVSMTGHYRIETRGLVVGGYLSQPRPTMLPDKKPPRSKLSPNAALARILQIYHKRIKRGIVGSGQLNNVLSLFSDRYSGTVCGGYQAKVLHLLDSLRFSEDPAERALVEGWDYGPIQAYGKWHQAVVIYPKGKTWTDDGIVLDPWPEQRPKRYSMAQWSRLFGKGTMHGIGGSKTYESQPHYPTVGGTYVAPGMRRLTAAERAWVKTLPPARRRQLKRRPKMFVMLAKRGYSRRNLTAKTVVRCPVNAYLVDRKGRISGFAGGRARFDIPGVRVGRLSLGRGRFWTELEYPGGAGLRLVLEGRGDGPVTVLANNRMHRPRRAKAAVRYSFRVRPGTRFEIAPGNGPLHGPGLELAPVRARLKDASSPPAPAPRPRGANAHAPPHRPPPHLPPPREPQGESTLFKINNPGGVQNHPRHPSVFHARTHVVVTKITTYHWNRGRGHRPGTIKLRRHNGEIFGPFKTRGRPAHGRRRNLYWDCEARIELPPGRYTVLDSHPESWAHNARSGHRGFVTIRGVGQR